MSSSKGASNVPYDQLKFIRTWHYEEARDLLGTEDEVNDPTETNRPPNSQTLSTEQLKVEIKEYEEFWGSTKGAARVKAILYPKTLNLFKELKIEQIIAVGLGGIRLLSTWPRDRALEGAKEYGGRKDGEYHKIANPSLHQLAFLNKLVDMVKSETGYTFKDKYIQEPSWGAVEEKFLSQYNFNILKYQFTPEQEEEYFEGKLSGRELMGGKDYAVQKAKNGKSTFVFAPGLPIEVATLYMEDKQAHPSVWLGTPMGSLFDEDGVSPHENTKKKIRPFIDATEGGLTKCRKNYEKDDEVWERSTELRWLK